MMYRRCDSARRRSLWRNRRAHMTVLATAAAALALALALLAAGSLPALAADSDRPAGAEPLPPPPAESKGLYDRYPLDAYTVDEGNYGSDMAARQAHNTVNLLMVGRAWLVKLSVRVAEQALTFRPAAELTVTARQLATQVAGVFWPRNSSLPAPLVVAALAAVGLWGFLLHLRGRSGAAWRTLLGSVLALIVAGATLAGLDGVLATLDQLSHELSRLSFAAATRPLGAAPEVTAPVQTAGDQAWQRLVQDPWLAAEFTDAGAADLYLVGDVPGAAILTLPPAERRSHFNSLSFREQERRFSPWRKDRLPARMLTAGAGLVGAAGWALGVLILAGGLLVYELLLLLLVVITPVVALLALWPGLGSRLAPAWGARLLGAALGKVAAGLLLGLFLTLSVGLFKLAAAGGWPLAAVFQWLLLIAVVRLRLYSPARLVAGAARFWQAGAEVVRSDADRTRDPGISRGPAAVAVASAHGSAFIPALTGAPAAGAPAVTHAAPPRPAAVLTGSAAVAAAPRTAGEQWAAELRRLQADLGGTGPQHPPPSPQRAAAGGGQWAAARSGGAPAAGPRQSAATSPVRVVQVAAENPLERPGGVAAAGGARRDDARTSPTAATSSGQPRPQRDAGVPGDRPPGLPE